jgi:hypothetical protein
MLLVHVVKFINKRRPWFKNYHKRKSKYPLDSFVHFFSYYPPHHPFKMVTRVSVVRYLSQLRISSYVNVYHSWYLCHVEWRKQTTKLFLTKNYIYIYILGTQNWWWLVIPILAKALRGGGSFLTCKMRIAETTIRSLEPPLFGLEVGSAIPKRPKEK